MHLTVLVVVALWGSPAGEVERVRAHLAGAVVQLQAADTSSLSPAQRARRALIIAELDLYQRRGVFPRNLQVAGHAPVFIDDRGVRCAMAHLIETFGGGAFVAHVAATSNYAYVRELADSEELERWLATHGLSVAEAARIQPTYPRGPGEPCDRNADCGSDLCIPALAGPALSYCSMPCDQGDPQACPLGMFGEPLLCQPAEQGAECRYTGQVPGTFGWTCDPAVQTIQCLSECISVGDGGICTRSCSPTIGCPTELSCRLWDESEGHHVCQRVDEGGCASTRGGGAAWPWLVAVLALLTLGGRSRREHRRRSDA